MTYSLIDAEGNVRDLASNLGLEQLREGAPNSILDLLNTGEIRSEDEQERVIAEVKDDKVRGYVADLIRDMKPPIVLSNGVVDEEEEGG